MSSWDPERYGTLSIPSDDYSFDIFTQTARSVGPDRSRSPIDPLQGLDVERLLARGASQSASRLATYINAIHPRSYAFDGYLVEVHAGFGDPLEVGDQVVDITTAEVPSPDNAIGASLGTHQFRDDLGVPVMVVNSELEAIACRGRTPTR